MSDKDIEMSASKRDKYKSVYDPDIDDDDDEPEPLPPLTPHPIDKSHLHQHQHRRDDEDNEFEESDSSMSSILAELPSKMSVPNVDSIPAASTSSTSSTSTTTSATKNSSSNGKSGKSKKKSKRQNSNDDDDDNDKKAKDDEAEVKLPPVAFFSLYRYCTAGEKLLLVVSIICALAVGAAQPLFMILFGGSISSIGGAGTIDQDIILNFVYLGVGMGVAGFLTSFCGTIVSNRLCDRVRLFYVRALLRQEIGWYDSQSTGKLVARVSGDIDLVQEGLNRVTMIFQALATFVGGFVVGFIKSWQLSLVIVACAPLLIGIGAFIGRLMAQMARQGQEAFADSIAIATEALGAVRLVHAFGGERQERALYDANVDKGTKETVGRMKFNGIGIGLALLIMQLIQSLALWYGSTLLADGSLDDVGNVFVALFAILIGAMSLGMIGEPLASLATARGVAAALYDVIDRRSDIDATTDESALRSAKGVRGRIEFRDVRFSYPTRPEVEVLKGLSFVVEPGKSLALIGKSGSGKSTSVGLIERWYRPTAGQVLIDDVPIEQYGVGSLRNRIALVSQEPVLFARSIRDNILLGAIADDPSAPVPTEEQMIRAAKRANCHDFITQLPQGYDTMVGEKSAARLSGGQKQRIAIARALIRDPVILLLDESTSALDTASERLVQDALNEISRTLTTITIAHRLSTIRDSSEIIFLQNGVVVERGTHEQLLERDGLYAMQHKAQARAEREASKRGASDVKAQADRVALTDSGGMAVKHVKGDKKTAAELEAAGNYAEVELSLWGAIRQMYEWVRPHTIELVLGSLFTLLLGAVDPLAALFQVQIMFSMFGLLIPDEAIKEASQRSVDQWVLVFVGIAVARGLLIAIRVIGLGRVASKVAGTLRKTVFGAMLSQEEGWFDRPENRVGALTAKLSADGGAVSLNITQVWPAMLTLISVVFTALVIGFVHCSLLAVVLMFALPLVTAGGFVRMRAMSGDSRKLRKTYERGGMLASEAVSQVRTVSSLHRERTFGSEYEREIGEASATLKRSNIYGALAFGVTQFIMFAVWALAFWYGSELIAGRGGGECSASGMFTAVMTVIFSGQQLGQAVQMLTDVDKMVDSVASIVTILRRRPPIDARRHPPTAVRDVELEVEARMKQVQFAYPTRPDQQILRGIDIVAPPGKTIAAVGASGSGKSTIISLFLRQYDATGGEVQLDRRDIRDYDLAFIRSKMAIVQQEPMLFNRSLRANIAYGVPQATQEQIEAAARMANCHDFIVEMPDGYDTMAGEGGSALSGGQRQRVAIARAVLRKPRILFLDEATSAIDNESQALVQAALEDARKNSTTIVVAHRLSTIQNADEILVVDRGRIVERGTHGELVAKKGPYYELVHHQLLVEGQN